MNSDPTAVTMQAVQPKSSESREPLRVFPFLFNKDSFFKLLL
jgi:hypothetical protein